jgi:hypothetical protein
MRKIKIIEHILLDGVIQAPGLFGVTPPRDLALVSTKAVGSGVIISTYTPSGPLRTSSYADA